MFKIKNKLWFILLLALSPVLAAEFSSSVEEAPVNSSVTLTWSSSANSCSAFGEWSGTKNGSGSEVVNVPSLGWNMYGINCNFNYEYVWVWGNEASTTPTNSAPTINGLPNSVSVQENQTAVTTVSASDTDGDTLTYSLSGTDAGALSISSSGVITFNSAPDYETKNSYSITVNVSDGTATTSKALTINITDVNEGGGSTSSSYDVSASTEHVCAIDDNGVACWGGSDPNGETNVPNLSNPSQVSAGRYNSCALDDNGVTCWGQDLGANQSVIAVPNLSNPKNVSLGDQFACSLDNSGVICWGYDGSGQISVPNLSNPTQVDSGKWHACAVDDTGVVCWGHDADGKISPPNLSNPTQVSAGSWHSCAIDDTGVVCWGWNENGQGNVPSLSNPTQVSAGKYQTCAIDDSGVKCWGYNGSGEIDVPLLSNPIKVSASEDYTCALDDNGVACWGSNSVGQTNVPNLSFTNSSSGNSSPPVISGPSSISVAENQTAVTTIVASDSDGDVLTYSLSGTDAGALSISSSGVITFNSAPDYETKNTYSVTVNVSDGNFTTSQTLTITVTDVEESSGSSSITVSSGAEVLLAFKTAPDFENPQDANQDNYYKVTVTVSDGQETISREITVRIDDVQD